MDIVQLRNGTEEPLPIVQTTTMSLRSLRESGFGGITQVYDLVEICHGRIAKVSKATLQALQDLALVQPDGSVHDSVKNIVLSSIEGEGMHMTPVSPLMRPEKLDPGKPKGLDL